MFNVVIDKSLCSGFGSCAELAPAIFKLEDSVATTRVGETGDPAVLDAAASCPMGAIAVYVVETGEQAA